MIKAGQKYLQFPVGSQERDEMNEPPKGKELWVTGQNDDQYFFITTGIKSGKMQFYKTQKAALDIQINNGQLVYIDDGHFSNRV